MSDLERTLFRQMRYLDSLSIMRSVSCSAREKTCERTNSVQRSAVVPAVANSIAITTN